MKDQKYDTAIRIMEEYVPTDEYESLSEKLLNRIEGIKKSFIDETLEYASAKMELDTIRKINLDTTFSELNAVEKYIDRLNASRTNFATAESFYATGDFAEAIRNYRLVIEEDASHAAAIEKLADAVSQYRDEILSKATEYANAELYTDAIALLNESLEFIPNDTKITEQIRIYEKNNADQLKADALDIAADYAKSGDYLNACKALNTVMKSQTTDAELVSAYNRYSNQYAAQIIGEADEKVTEQDFDGAISILKVALKELPGNTKLSGKLDEVEAKSPISITSLTAINSDEWGQWNAGIAADPFGNDYTNACNYVQVKATNGIKPYAEYRLYGKYTILTGIVAPHADYKEASVCCIQVYADDKLVYTSPEITRKSDAVTFEINVAGAEYIRFEVQRDMAYYCPIILSDVKLWP